MPKKNFEDALKQLDEIIDQLENENLSLEVAVKKFEEGMKLSKFCSEKLDEAEKKISILKKDMESSIKTEQLDH